MIQQKDWLPSKKRKKEIPNPKEISNDKLKKKLFGLNKIKNKNKIPWRILLDFEKQSITPFFLKKFFPRWTNFQLISTPKNFASGCKESTVMDKSFCHFSFATTLMETLFLITACRD